MSEDESKFLILISSNLSASQYLSLLAFLETFEVDPQNIDILISPVLKVFEDFEPIDKYSRIEELAEQKYLLQFENQSDKVNSIQWNQTDKNLNIYVSMEKGKLNMENITFDSVGNQYSTIYTFGLETLDDLGEKYSKSREYIFSDSDIVAFGRELKIKGKKIQSNALTGDVSMAEEVYKYMKEQTLNINSKAATDLLAAIYISTDNFKKVSKPEVFAISAELVKADADTQRANELVDRAKSIRKN